MQIKRMPISDLQQRKKELEAAARLGSMTSYIREELGIIKTELKCRYNPSTAKR